MACVSQADGRRDVGRYGQGPQAPRDAPHKEDMMTADSSDAPVSEPLFQLLVLGDFCGATEADKKAPQRVDKTNFDEVLAGFAPKVRFKVDDYLSGGKVPLEVELTFSAMRDFHPISILERATGPRPYFATCKTLASLARGEVSTPQAIQQLERDGVPNELRRMVEGVLSETGVSPEPPAGQTPPEKQQDILSSVAMPEKTSKDVRSTVDSFIEGLGIPRKEVAKSPQRQAAAELLHDLCSRLHAVLDAVLHHPAFQALESAWRGLHLLVTRTEFDDPPIAIHVAHCRRAEVGDALRTHLDAVQATNSHGADAALVDFSFDQTAEDLALLGGLAGAAEEAYCPAIAAGSSRLLGIENNDYSTLPRSLRTRFDAPELIEWRAFRRSEQAQYVALMLPDIVGRLPYGPKTIPVKEIAYQEGRAILRTRGVWVVGAGMLRSVSRMGWAVAFSGQQEGRLDNMPIAPIERGGTEAHLAAETVWTDEQTHELARAGFVVLSARPNQNRLCVTSVPTLYEPPPAADAAESRQALLHATLPYRLFATRIARAMSTALGRLTPAMGDREIESTLQNGLLSLFNQPVGVRVKVSPAPEEPAQLEVSVQVQPDFLILGQEPDLTLNFALHG